MPAAKTARLGRGGRVSQLNRETPLPVHLQHTGLPDSMNASSPKAVSPSPDFF